MVVTAGARVFVLIPAYNEAAHLGAVIDDLRSCDFTDIVVCDDGSTDDTSAVARAKGALVVRHPLRRGAGAAVYTAMEVALRRGAEVVVLVDGDGQHHARDARKLVTALAEHGVAVALGNRMHDPAQIPFVRRQFNRLGTLVTRLLGGARVCDSQCGLRALTAAGAHALPVRSDGYEFCSEMIRQLARQRLPFIEVPVGVTYHQVKTTKGQNLANGITTAWRLFLRAFS
jgi:glycosyltransferase involved in cell wall biosynthesis